MTRIMIRYIATAIWMMVLVSMFFPAAGAAQERLSVNVDTANMRSGPGTNHDELWQVEKYHPVVVVEKQKDWYKIKDFENDMAWIHKSLLSSASSVITIKDKCNIRSGPGTDNPIVFTAERGVPFRVLETKGSWIKIQHADNDIGWIYKTLVW